VLSLTLAVLLSITTSLPIVVLGLIFLGGPAGVGASLVFAQLKDSGARPNEVVNTRALVSVAWVAGPPLATAIMGLFGIGAILAAIAGVAVLNIATSAGMLAERSRARARPTLATATDADDGGRTMSRVAVGVVVLAFVALQATNVTVVSVLSLYVSQGLGLALFWAGIALGVAAGLEIGALLLIGRLTDRFPGLLLLATGCLTGIAYYIGMAFVSGPAMLIGLQVLNAWFFASVAGVGLTLFQRIIPRPGLASGLFVNTRRLGAIASGPIIALGSMTVLGYAGVFLACAGLTVLALVLIGAVGMTTRRS
jgi:SET family sugar efflux transporter-like MFS transporter